MKMLGVISTGIGAAMLAGLPAAAQERIDLSEWNEAQMGTGFSAEAMVGHADVYDVNNEEIGEVEDIIIGPDGKIRSLVIEAGGLWDMGDTHFAYPFEDATIVNQDRVEVQLNDERIEDYSVFGDIDSEPIAGRAFRITELLNDYAYLEGDARYGWVDDVIISEEGEIAAVIVQPDVGYAGARGAYAWPWYGYDYGFEPGQPFYQVPYTPEDVAVLTPFDYQRVGIQQAREPEDMEGEGEMREGQQQ